MKATTFLIGSVFLNVLIMVHGFGADPGKAGPPAASSPTVYTLDNVVIDRFQARDATLADVLEALGVLSYNATNHRYRPTFVVIGSATTARPVNLNLSRSSLSDAIALLAEDSGLQVTHRQGSVIFSSRQ